MRQFIPKDNSEGLQYELTLYLLVILFILTLGLKKREQQNKGVLILKKGVEATGAHYSNGGWESCLSVCFAFWKLSCPALLSLSLLDIFRFAQLWFRIIKIKTKRSTTWKISTWAKIYVGKNRLKFQPDLLNLIYKSYYYMRKISAQSTR